jgi:hypothetical protein
MAGTVIPMGKRRPVTKPYLTIVGVGGWTWKVLKAYTHSPDARFARWHVEVNGDMGDEYVQNINGRIVQRDPEVPDSAIPSWLR